MEKTISFPPSVQSDLFNYLKPQQREAIRPYLRLIKRPYQEKLCVSLLDYLEGHGLDPLQQPVLRMLQQQIIEACNLHPLTSPHSGLDPEPPSSCGRSHIKCGMRSFIKQMFSV